MNSNKVKFIWNGSINFNKMLELTYNKIYDVITYKKFEDPCNDTIKILNDGGNVITYYLRTKEDTYFIDATAELRNDTIDEILN